MAPSEIDDPLYVAALEGHLTLTKEGEWRHDGVSFSNRKLAELFHRSIHWDESTNTYQLRIGKGGASFRCEDTAFFVTSIDDRTSPWRLELADGTIEVLRTETISIGPDDQIYCRVKNGHRARFSRSAHQIVLRHAIDDHSLEIDGKTVTPPNEGTSQR